MREINLHKDGMWDIEIRDELQMCSRTNENKCPRSYDSNCNNVRWMWSFGWGGNFQEVWQCFHRCMFVGRPKSSPQQCPIEARMRSTLPSWSDMFRCELEKAERLWDVFLQSKHVRPRAKLPVSQSRWTFQLDNIFYFKFNRGNYPNLTTITFFYSVYLGIKRLSRLRIFVSEIQRQVESAVGTLKPRLFASSPVHTINF